MTPARIPRILSPMPRLSQADVRRRWKSIRVYEFLGIEVVRTAPGSARLRLPWRLELTQPLGYIHGGIIATLADAAAGWALFQSVSRPEGCTTLEMKINFLSPVVKAAMVADAKVLRLGHSTAVIDVDVRAARTLCAKSLVTYFVRR